MDENVLKQNLACATTAWVSMDTRFQKVFLSVKCQFILLVADLSYDIHVLFKIQVYCTLIET